MITNICGLDVSITYKNNMNNIKFRFINGVIHVTCPKISVKEIEKYIQKNYEEFYNKLNESVLSNNFTYINGQKYEIELIEEKYKSIIIEDQIIKVTKGSEEKLIKNFFISTVENFINKNKYLLNRFPNINEPNFKIRRLKSSYGQYNKKTHTITLDYRLAKYDEMFLYLTFAHELCHMVHFDHSRDFYELLDTFVADSKKAHKIMKKIIMDDIF